MDKIEGTVDRVSFEPGVPGRVQLRIRDQPNEVYVYTEAVGGDVGGDEIDVTFDGEKVQSHHALLARLGTVPEGHHVEACVHPATNLYGAAVCCHFKCESD